MNEIYKVGDVYYADGVEISKEKALRMIKELVDIYTKKDEDWSINFFDFEDYSGDYPEED